MVVINFNTEMVWHSVQKTQIWNSINRKEKPGPMILQRSWLWQGYMQKMWESRTI